MEEKSEGAAKGILGISAGISFRSVFVSLLRGIH